MEETRVIHKGCWTRTRCGLDLSQLKLEQARKHAVTAHWDAVTCTECLDRVDSMGTRRWSDVTRHVGKALDGKA
jgi:hypothetical protein